MVIFFYSARSSWIFITYLNKLIKKRTVTDSCARIKFSDRNKDRKTKL